ncbi:hypothetical protein H5A44_17455 [Pectobacterium brasiliense]|uniref:hypothetical protein n=1 Tax=Pectobacterium brasiliense TaxID=180957 RepID=UPI001969A97E|nr:hypothetical protein [Pectobacterium brasiliense]MBN3344205.1 hypothetical protein [Pectobacterium brasiliense]
MSKNVKQTSENVASTATKTLTDPKASAIQKSLAGSALCQRGTSNQTSGKMEDKVSSALDNPRYSELTKQLAALVLAQSNKGRK